MRKSKSVLINKPYHKSVHKVCISMKMVLSGQIKVILLFEHTHTHTHTYLYSAHNSLYIICISLFMQSKYVDKIDQYHKIIHV